MGRGYVAPSPAQTAEGGTRVNAFQAECDKGPAARVAEVEGGVKRVAEFQIHRHNSPALWVDCENSLPLHTAETEGDGMGVAAFQVDHDHAPAPCVAEAQGERMRAAAFWPDCNHA